MKLLSIFLTCAMICIDPEAPRWEKGFVGRDRFAEYSKDEDNADMHVFVDQDGKLDIGINQADSKTGSFHSVTFSLRDLEAFFRHQRHRTFIVVTYHKNAPNEDLGTSLTRLKKYFAKAGYQRVLLTHAHSSGVIIHEDFRPQTAAAVEKP